MKLSNIIAIAFFIMLKVFGVSVFAQPAVSGTLNSAPWRFVVIGDTHAVGSDTVKEMIPFILEDSPELILAAGDLVDAGKLTSAAELQSQLKQWQDIFKPLYDKGIIILPVRGNHENDANDDITAWNNVFSGEKLLPQNGPEGEKNLTYSLIHKNALFIALDNYVNIHTVNQSWLDGQLASAAQPHIFVFGHEAAFKVFHTDCLDDNASQRNAFWKSLKDAGARVYFCGHDHFYDAAQIDDGDGNTANDLVQIVSGGGGGWLMSRYNYNGNNVPYSIKNIRHIVNHGYILAELSGDGAGDLSFTLTYKERVIDSLSSTVKYISLSEPLKLESQRKTSGAEETAYPPEIQRGFSLYQNYPNPFNPVTTIEYSLREPGNVTVTVYNILMEKVKILADEYKNAGRYKVEFNAVNLPGGCYIYTVSHNGLQKACKMTLLK